MLPIKMCFRIIQIVFVIFVIMYFNVLTKGLARSEKVPIGVVFEKDSDEIQAAFKFAMMHHASSNRSRQDFQLFVDVINTADAFKLSRLICHQFTRGVVSMLGAVTPDSFDTLHSYTNTFQVPFVTPWFPEKVLPPSSGLVDYAVSLRPDYHRAVIDTVAYYGWKTIVYIYDSHDGLLRLQQLFQSFDPAKAKFRITHVKRVTNATEVVTFLLTLERADRWSNKYVILDSSTRLAKEAVILHVRDTFLGRRNYHYFLTGLVMDDRWEKETVEYGAINITGFRVLDYSRKLVRDFIDAWKRKGISAHAALMYDTVQVLVDSILRLTRKKPELLRVISRRNTNMNNSKLVDCNPLNKDMVPFDFGEKLSRTIKRTEIDGLTGYIRFDEEGHRQNFTLQVMEMTIAGEMMKIGTWYGSSGLVPTTGPKASSKYYGAYDRSKIYVISTIVEAPYVSNIKVDPTQLEGFCVDLAKLIMDHMEIKYTLRTVVDGKYGKVAASSAGGWDGLIGELVRKEVDLVIAPLAVTAEREKVVDFSKAFLSFDVNGDQDDSPSLISTFTFFRPLSVEVWLLVFCSMLVVSFCLYLVARFSPQEWRQTSTSDSDTIATTPDNEHTPNTPALVNEFSFFNSIWFSLGSFMQQGSDIAPRTLSGRIIGMVWWFFAFVVVTTYTANLTSYLTINRINEPIRTYTKLTSCPEDYRTPRPKDTIAQSRWFSYFNHIKDDEYKPCEMLVSAIHSGVKDFAVALPKGSNLRDGVNLAIQNLRNDGELQNLVRRWFLDTKCSKDLELKGKQLTLNQVAGLFYILIGGMCVSMVVAFFEFLRHGRAQRANATRSGIRSGIRGRVTQDMRQDTPQRSRRRQQERLDWNGGAYSEYYAAGSQSGQEETEVDGNFSQV